MLHAETVCESTLDLLKDILQIPDLSSMRLVGGTALSLQLGHRTSVDLDFFGKFDPMKLSAAANCGKKKDFIDIAVLLERFPIDQMFARYQRKFGVSEIAFALRGLTYFDDAEEDPMPKMFVSLTWDEVKTRILSAVRDFVKLV